MSTITWKRNSHGLFDYECNNVVKTSSTIKGWMFVKRIGDVWLTCEPRDFDFLEEDDVLWTIAFINDSYWLYHSWTLIAEDIEKILPI